MIRLITIKGRVPEAGRLLKVSGEQVKDPEYDVSVDLLVREAGHQQPRRLGNRLRAESVQKTWRDSTLG